MYVVIFTVYVDWNNRQPSLFIVICKGMMSLFMGYLCEARSLFNVEWIGRMIVNDRGIVWEQSWYVPRYYPGVCLGTWGSTMPWMRLQPIHSRIQTICVSSYHRHDCSPLSLKWLLYCCIDFKYPIGSN